MNNNPNYKDAGFKGGNVTKQKWKKIKEDYLNNNPCKCSHCGEVLPYTKRKNKFCSNSCSVSTSNKDRKITESQKNKTAKTLKEKSKTKYLKNPNKCTVCDTTLDWDKRKRKTCSDKCLHQIQSISGQKGGFIGGKISAQVQSKTRRSKNEKLFAKKCKEYFNNVLTNEPMFNGWDADVIIEDIKVAVLWNGKWHYEKITEAHSVKQVQNRDRIKIKEINKSGYTPYIIKDMGKYNPDKVQNEFDIFINNFYI